MLNTPPRPGWFQVLISLTPWLLQYNIRLTWESLGSAKPRLCTWTWFLKTFWACSKDYLSMVNCLEHAQKVLRNQVLFRHFVDLCAYIFGYCFKIFGRTWQLSHLLCQNFLSAHLFWMPFYGSMLHDDFVSQKLYWYSYSVNSSFFAIFGNGP